LVSLALLGYSLAAVLAVIINESGTAYENGIARWVAIPLFAFLLLWLAVIEGGQGCLVGLQTTPKAHYSHSHPISHMCTEISHAGDNMERFIVGRQFLVVLLIFGINTCGSALAGTTVLGMAPWAATIFLGNALAMILVTVNIGQLTAQVNAAECMLDFINNYSMLLSVYVSLAIEMSGLLHCVYLVQVVFSYITGKPIESNEPPRDGSTAFFFWARVAMSSTLLSYAVAVQGHALFNGWTNMWEGVPVAVAIPMVVLLLGLVGIMEGMQIAAFAVRKMDPNDYASHTVAKKNLDLLFSGRNLGRFLIGRQLAVCTCMFIAARVFSINKGHVDISSGSTSFDASSGFQDFINTGLMGALVTTCIGCLIWRIIASSYPLMFMSNPLIYGITQLCLAMEFSGICAASWALGGVHRAIAGFKEDSFYLRKYDAAANNSEDV
jgi:hypothetical protein